MYMTVGMSLMSNQNRIMFSPRYMEGIKKNTRIIVTQITYPLDLYMHWRLYGD